MSSLLDIKNLSCGFGEEVIVKNFNLQLESGTIGCLLGGSGSGKSTVLRVIAGLHPLQSGEIQLLGETIGTVNMQIPPQARSVGMVFQEYALFPHLTVSENIAFGLRHLTTAEKQGTVGKLLDWLSLYELDDRYPDELSGGQQQRVAIARALARKPKLLLMDEPFSNLDLSLRKRLASDLRELLVRENITALVVTHDQNEAFLVADKIGILHQQHLQQWDTPYNLYHEPINKYVAQFIGQGRFVPGKLVSPHSVTTVLGTIEGNRAYPWPVGSEVEVLFRPDDITLSCTATPNCEIIKRSFLGAEILYEVRFTHGLQLYSMLSSSQEYATGQKVEARLKMDHLVLFQ
ncbi:MAG TPA: iron ABC transporter ATP-binding protein [Gammaproteobacteria bacterium]|nr:iron ABC transporter ATP-binding protein [Gammaproteobacteria bacterium]